jgi:hypothetical protein
MKNRTSKKGQTGIVIISVLVIILIFSIVGFSITGGGVREIPPDKNQGGLIGLMKSIEESIGKSMSWLFGINQIQTTIAFITTFPTTTVFPTTIPTTTTSTSLCSCPVRVSLDEHDAFKKVAEGAVYGTSFDKIDITWTASGVKFVSSTDSTNGKFYTYNKLLEELDKNGYTILLSRPYSVIDSIPGIDFIKSVFKIVDKLPDAEYCTFESDIYDGLCVGAHSCIIHVVTSPPPTIPTTIVHSTTILAT